MSTGRLGSALNVHNAAAEEEKVPVSTSSSYRKQLKPRPFKTIKSAQYIPKKTDVQVNEILEKFFLQIPKDGPKQASSPRTTQQTNKRFPAPRTPAPKTTNSLYSRVDLEKRLQPKSSSTVQQLWEGIDKLRKQRQTDPAPSSRPLNLQGPPTTFPEPRWRMQSNANTIRSKRLPDQQTKSRDSAAALFKNSPKRKEKHQFIDPRSQTVKIPARSVSLVEASALFHVKVHVIQRTLKRVGVTKADKDDDVLLDPETLELLALELDIEFERDNRRDDMNQNDDELLLKRRSHVEENFAPRPPVVCIMGHVDHGKTTLMDALRRKASGTASNDKKKRKEKKAKVSKGAKSSSDDVAGTEAGGITQTISAFQVPLSGYEFGAVTFLDTPGHAAFKSMRQSGSDAADVIVLVVAADDGVSEQTIEILNFYKSIVKGSNGGISLIVAMNKIDKPGIDIEEARRRIESQLLEQGILVEGMPSSDIGEYGPPAQLFPISGLTGEGLDDLIEGLALQSEVMDLRADESARAEGVVLDARVDKGLGIVVDCIIRWGSIQKGDIVVSGTNQGKVRLLKDVKDQQLKKATPSQPVRIIGFDTVPKAGDPLVVAASDEVADDLIERRKALEALQAEQGPTDISDAELQSAGKSLMNHAWEMKLKQKYGIQDSEDSPIRIPVIVKASADGSLAAIRDCLVAIADESKLKVVIDPVKQGVGPVTAVEIQMAKECGAAIFCFNIKNEQRIVTLANEVGVSLCQNDVIYRLLEEAKEQFADYLPLVPTEVVHGRGKVKAVYEIGGSGKVAGMQVIDGILYKDKSPGSKACEFRVVRDGEVISTDTKLRASSLKHFREDVNEISKGKDCGLSLLDFDGFEEGDVIECFSTEMKKQFV